jgi:hypothetical protein
MFRTVAIALLSLAAAQAADAACVNRFVSRAQRGSHQVTLLTGRLTFQEAQALAAKIQNGDAPRLEWVTDGGKSLAKQIGDLKVVRPMPVGCDGKSSGVVMIANFLAINPPQKKMLVKLDGETTVAFEEQVN